MAARSLPGQLVLIKNKFILRPFVLKLLVIFYYFEVHTIISTAFNSPQPTAINATHVVHSHLFCGRFNPQRNGKFLP